MRRPALAVLGVLALAFAVAAAVKRAPPDFAALRPIAVIRDAAGHPLWEIRLARAAHEIAVTRLGAAPPAADAYRLWLAGAGGGRSLGLLPLAGRAVIPEIPAIADRLAGGGELFVTRETAPASAGAQPAGPVLFRAAFRPEASAAD